MKTFLKLVLIFTIIKSIVWSLIVPLWHFPDEQAHFGHVAYLAEGHPLPHGKNKDLTEEIYISEGILGTQRDLQGNNKFTYHPEYRLPYSQSLDGPDEDKIKKLSLDTRKNLVFKESAYYPHFYYQVSAKTYHLFYYSNLFIRVFAVRLFWLFTHLLTILLVFKTSQLLFPKQKSLVILSTVLTTMHPMFSFVSGGVTSDVIHNLMFTAVIYFSLKLIKNTSLFDFIFLLISFSFGIVNKPQFILASLVILPAIIIFFIKQPKLLLKSFLILLASLSFTYLLSPLHITPLIKTILKGKIPYFDPNRIVNYVKPDYSLFEHLKWTINHTIREVLPWYWGVFNWLGVTLPRLTNQILMRLLAISGLGLIIKVYQIIKSKKFDSSVKLLGFIAFSAVIYFLSLFFWDWHHVRSNGFSFGIQGRYYFPTIMPHMILLAVGFTTAANLIKSPKIRLTLLYLLLFWFVLIQLIGLHTVAGAYYDLSSIKSFIIQASQYKPWFAKGAYLVAALVFYFTSLTSLLVYVIKAKLLHEK